VREQEKTMLETKPPVVVLDIPKTTSADDAARILSEQVARGYYVRGMTEGEPMRVVFAQYAGADDNKCEEELRAMDLVVAHRKETTMRIVQILCEHDIYRGAQWVSKVLMDLA
jgi:hypothetical protein